MKDRRHGRDIRGDEREGKRHTKWREEKEREENRMEKEDGRGRDLRAKERIKERRRGDDTGTTGQET